ncbi:ATP-dependent DNA helicase RecG [gamma proteobacterium HTCC5015]|nr:ATP-dependent DNA helicase RecG [gamma proteobacterium HTCC5015]
MSLTASVTQFKGVGPALAEKLARLPIHTVQDVLFHLPLRYQDRTRVTPICALQHGAEVVVEGEVEHAEIVIRRRRQMLVQLSDGTGSLVLRFFYFSQAQKNALERGTRIRCFGEARETALGRFEMVHPEYRYGEQAATPMETALTPIYPATDGVSQSVLRKLTDQALEHVDTGLLPDLIPADCLPPSLLNVPTLGEALHLLHRPPPTVSLAALAQGGNPAQQRLAFEELLAHQLSMLLLRQRVQSETAVPIGTNTETGAPSQNTLRRQFMQALPFQLTQAQQRVVKEIDTDIARDWPSLRLVQGDVGSGKTVVAALALLAAVECGQQAAMMAPTELLAEQHWQTLSAWFEPLGIRVGWLSSRVKGAKRRQTLAELASGDVALVVGTHALFQEEVIFQRLALLVVDEQHRFGVHQRLALREKGQNSGISPHQVIMTATPIPRTLAMTAYADLDYSVIDELPPGRTPIKTVALAESRRADVIERIRSACEQGRQVYWVCTLIEESEMVQCQAAEDTASSLAEAMPAVRIGLVHGRMKPADKERTMAQFKAGDIDLLVATTVIEVGVDVPNASLMVIENAERLGLSQLHQLRGRVGRGAVESSCVLLYKNPLGEKARRRLDTMRRSNDGFEIAREDLDMRGPGEVLGTRQTGDMSFRVADLTRDEHLVDAIHQLAGDWIEQRHPNIQPLVKRWLSGAEKFSSV